MAKRKLMFQPEHNAMLPSLKGVWLMAEDRITDMVSRVRAAIASYESDPTANDDQEEPGYHIENGIANIEIIGVLTKYPSIYDGWCGFCPTETLMDYLNRAMADSTVKALRLHIDCYGGMVSGTTEFGEAVAKANLTKPVYATVSDACHSGGYWIASQCQNITANANAFVGCIGVYLVLCDDSKFWQEMGVKFTVVGSGGVKGAGADGVVSAELIADCQREINNTFDLFIAAVAAGRGMKDDEARKLGDGRSWIAAESKKLGLIDEVVSVDAAMTAILMEVIDMTNDQFMKELAEHPEWIAGEREQAKKLGAKETRDSEKSMASAVREACAGNDTLALDLILAGKDAEDAKIAVNAIKRESDATAKARADADAAIAKANADADAKLKAANAEIERLKAEAGVQGAVGTAGSAKANAGKTAKAEKDAASATEFDKIEDPKTRAKAEWDADFNGCKANFQSEAAYTGFRTAELRGRVNLKDRDGK